MHDLSGQCDPSISISRKCIRAELYPGNILSGFSKMQNVSGQLYPGIRAEMPSRSGSNIPVGIHATGQTTIENRTAFSTNRTEPVFQRFKPVVQWFDPKQTDMNRQTPRRGARRVKSCVAQPGRRFKEGRRGSPKRFKKVQRGSRGSRGSNRTALRNSMMFFFERNRQRGSEVQQRTARPPSPL